MNSKIITIYGSSRPEPGCSEYEFAMLLGQELARNGFVVCNGGYSGIMEASSKGARNASGHVIGVTVKGLDYVPPNKYLSRQIVMPNIFLRIQKMMELGNACIVLKGGTGTLVELAVAWEFVNKGFVEEKPVIIAGDFWDPLISIMVGENSIGEFYTKDGRIKPCTDYLIKINEISDIVTFLKEKFAV